MDVSHFSHGVAVGLHAGREQKDLSFCTVLFVTECANQGALGSKEWSLGGEAPVRDGKLIGMLFLGLASPPRVTLAEPFISFEPWSSHL